MKSEFQNTKVILGLMRLEDVSVDKLTEIIKGCLSLGIHYFDISDVYLNHDAERKLGQVLLNNPELRSQMFIQTKCGILKNNQGEITCMDLSYQHIKESAYASIERMHIDHINSFLLHRVDIFMDAKEINQAISELYKEGKIIHFGVSNMDKDIIEYLKSEITLPIEVDQLQVSLGQLSLISETFNVNFPQQNPNLSNGLFFYLKKNNIQLQCWSPYQIGFFEGSIFDERKLPELNLKLKDLAIKYNTSKCSIATAFLSMLTKDCQVITGSMNINHIKETLEGTKIILSKEDWYSLYKSTGNLLP